MTFNLTKYTRAHTHVETEKGVKILPWKAYSLTYLFKQHEVLVCSINHSQDYHLPLEIGETQNVIKCQDTAQRKIKFVCISQFEIENKSILMRNFS
jgi:hypothetical protein